MTEPSGSESPGSASGGIVDEDIGAIIVATRVLGKRQRQRHELKDPDQRLLVQR